MWQMLKASAQILDRIWSHQNGAKIWEGTEWYASPPASLFFDIWMLVHLHGSPKTTCALFLPADQQS
jgi:hypothetical protein